MVGIGILKWRGGRSRSASEMESPARPAAGLRSPFAWLVAVVSLSSVAPLLGWLYGIAPFRTLFARIALPGMAAVVIISVWLATHRADAQLLRALRVGVLSGIVGTIGYDLFRVPFVVAGGLRLLSPIDSYGVLLLGAEASSGLTAFSGWAYHFSNGLFFAVIYAALAYRRHWGWGVAWALLLETGTLVTPFADAYRLQGKELLILLAYAAHVPYGLALGMLVQRGDQIASWLDQRRYPVAAMVGGTCIALALWLQPWQSPATGSVAQSADVAIIGARFTPEFVRRPVGYCVSVANFDETTYLIETDRGVVAVPSNEQAELCYGSGVHRVRTSGIPFDGGFFIMDETIREWK